LSGKAIIISLLNYQSSLDTLRYRINHQIKAPEIRVISDAGDMVGVMSVSEALRMAEEQGLDLVEISPQAKPPVCKLIAYDKFKYQQKKLEQAQKKKAKKVEMKTVRLSARIGTHDLEVKAKQTDGFLEDGDMIRIELRMRGREQAFAQLAEQQIKNFQALLTKPYRVDVPQKRMGNTISLTIVPSK